MPKRPFPALTALILVCASPVLAGGPSVAVDDAVAPVYIEPMRPTLSFTVRGGLAVSPDYFGSSDYALGPDFGFGIDHLRFGSLEFGSPDPDARSVGFGLHGSARYIGARDASDYPELTGLSDVDASLELGAGLHYQTDMFRAFADVRYGVIGHEAVAGDAGLDLILRPSDRWTMTFGPRVSYGNGRFSDTYFGVTPAESTASGLAAYDAKGGILGAGLELGATYKVNNLWGVEGAVSWTRLQNSAAGSPITQQGDRDQYGVRLGLTRRITLNF